MKKISFILISIFCILFFAACNKKKTETSAPANAVEALKARGEFVLGHDGNFPPLAFINENKELTGFDIELAQEVAKRLGVKFRAVVIDWDDKEEVLNNGTVDCIWDGFSITDKRKNQYEFSFPYLANEQVILVRSSGTVKTINDLSGRVVGYRSTSSSRDAIEKNPSFMNALGDMIAYKDNKSVLADLKVGLLDAIVIDSIVADYYIAQTGEPLAVISTSLSAEEYCVGFRKTEPELRAEVEKILKEMYVDGTLASISKKWFGKDLSLIGK